MKKIILIISIFVTIFTYSSLYAEVGGSSNTGAGAVTGSSKPTPTNTSITQKFTPLQNPLKVGSIEGVIFLAVDIAIYIGVSFAILAIIFVGFKFVMARGDQTALKNAKEWFMYIIIGLAILISARVTVEIVQNTLIKSGVVNEKLFK
ncbi:MAG: hypothetical protein AAB683_01515 [Patescibacteria group bacterium]